jgi:hypothetical protein
MGVETIHPEFVPVVFASDLESAEDYRALLERYNIPALIDDETGCEHTYTALGRGVPVLVPDQMHDRASEVLAGGDSELPVWCASDDDVDEEDDDDYYDDDDDDADDEDDEDEDDDDDDFDDEGFDDLDDLDDDYEEGEEEGDA